MGSLSVQINVVCIWFVTDSPKRGLMLKPEVEWDRSKIYHLVISSTSDSDYEKSPTTRKSVTGSRVFLNDVLVIF